MFPPSLNSITPLYGYYKPFSWILVPLGLTVNPLYVKKNQTGNFWSVQIIGPYKVFLIGQRFPSFLFSENSIFPDYREFYIQGFSWNSNLWVYTYNIVLLLFLRSILYCLKDREFGIIYFIMEYQIICFLCFYIMDFN